MENLTLIKPEKVQNIINKFCYTIGMIPTSYKVSLTYEEQIIAIGHYLEETVIPALNNNAEAVAELQSLFVQLKDYVENYFDNLDVQTEINNKLDEMVQDGTLQEIITSYLNVNGILAFNTVNDMKNSTNLINGSSAITLGYSAVNDGGKSYYKIRNITNADVVDETHIIALNNTDLVAELINPFEINPDNFSGNNDNEKMQNAINYATKLFAQNIPIIINLNRIFNITQTLSLDIPLKRIPFSFNSQNGGGFYKNTSGLLFDTTKEYVSDIQFLNITFKSDNGSGIIIMTSPKFVNIKFLNCCFKNIDKAIYSSSYLQSITFDNCLITGGQDNFIEFYGSYYLNIVNCIIEHRLDKFLIYQNFSTEIEHNRQFFTNISNNLIEGFSGQNSGFLYITYYELINITNNYFESLWNTIIHDCKIGGGNLNILNNRLYQGSNITNKQNTGFLKMLPFSQNNLRMGNINFKNNKINNTYAIYFDMDYINAIDGQTNRWSLNYQDNDVLSFINSSFAIDGLTNQAHFNILPIFRNSEEGTSKYNRINFWNISNKITWNETLEINNISYPIYYKFFNGNLFANVYITSHVTTNISSIDLYFGFDVYLDDLYTVSSDNSITNVISFFRNGSNNNKYLKIYAQGNKDLPSAGFYATVQLCGRRG